MNTPSSAASARPKVVVVGLGPAGGAMVPDAARRTLEEAARVVVRTARHPAVETLDVTFNSFDALYDKAEDYDALYGAIVEELVSIAAHVHAHGG